MEPFTLTVLALAKLKAAALAAHDTAHMAGLMLKVADEHTTKDEG